MGEACSMLEKFVEPGRRALGGGEQPTYGGSRRGSYSRNQAPGSGPVQLQSRLTGRRRSLLVGINYEGTNMTLSGCKADVIRMRDFLVEHLGFPNDHYNQRVLIEDYDHTYPTRDNMIEAFRWLAEGARPGDALFFHYSGHGGRVRNSRQADGYSETLCPLDCQENGQLLDEEMFELLVRPLPSGVKLTVILDCCHSAGALNLPYLFTGTADNIADARKNLVKMAMSTNWAHHLRALQAGRPLDLLQDLGSLGLGAWQVYNAGKQGGGGGEGGFSTDEAGNVGLAVGEVVCFTGCRSDQTSADVGNVEAQFSGIDRIGTRTDSFAIDPNDRTAAAGGALTSCFIETMDNGEPLTYVQLLERIRQRLAQLGFSQVPQLASSMALELNQPFALDTITLPGHPSSTGVAGTENHSAVSGFMSSLNRCDHGRAVAQGSRGVDGSSPWQPEALSEMASQAANMAQDFLARLAK